MSKNKENINFKQIDFDITGKKRYFSFITFENMVLFER